MAASIDPKMACRMQHIEELLDLLSTQFLEMVPVRRMKWTDDEAAALVATPKLQQRVLQATVLNPVCRLHPPALSYRTHFMKQLMQKLEQMDAEICDEVYEAYTELLSQREDEEDILCFKTYTVPNGDRISLQESVNLVSQGTTGLSTWQAAEHMAEWVVENPGILKNKKVVELGCGLGLTGMVACRVCNIKSYTFTDCHSQVLFLLAKNIERNLSQSQAALSSGASSANHLPTEPDSRDQKMFRKIKRQLSLTSDRSGLSVCCAGETSGMFEEEVEVETLTSPDQPGSSGVSRSPRGSRGDEEDEISATDDDDISEAHSEEASMKLEVSQTVWETDASQQSATFRADPRISVCCLDWEDPSPAVLDRLQADVILAADVVYDPSIIHSLVRVLRHLLDRGPTKSDSRCAYIASTVRNEDTRDAFLIALGSEGLSYSVVEGPKKQLFHYDRMVPIEIIQVSLGNSVSGLG